MENAGAVFFRETLLLLDPATATLAETQARGRGDRARARPHVVRRSRHDGLVGRSLAQRGLRHLDGVLGRRRLAARVAHVARLPARALRRARARRARAHASDLLRGAHRRRGERELRSDHLREGRVGGAHARALPRADALPDAACAPTSAAIARATRSRRISGARSRELRASRSRPWRARGSSRPDIRCCRCSRSRERGRTLLTLAPGALRPAPACAQAAQAGALADPVGRPRRDAPARVRASSASWSGRRRERIDLGRGVPRFVYGNADEGGFFRPLHDAAELRALVALAAAALGDRAHGTRRPPVGARARGPRGPRRASSSSAAALANERDPDVLLALRRPLGFIGGSLIPDATPASAPRFERFVARSFGPAFAALGWETRSRRERDDARPRARRCSDSWAASRTRAPVVAEASARCERYLADRRSLDPNLADGVTSIAARAGDARRHRRFLDAMRRADTPQEQRRFLFALADFREPDADRAHARADAHRNASPPRT